MPLSYSLTGNVRSLAESWSISVAVSGCTPTPGAGTAGRAYVATYPN